LQAAGLCREFTDIIAGWNHYAQSLPAKTNDWKDKKKEVAKK
jgi:hypothetical protein